MSSYSLHRTVLFLCKAWSWLHCLMIWLVDGFGWFLFIYSASHNRLSLSVLISLYTILIAWQHIWYFVNCSRLFSWCDLCSPDIQLPFSHHSSGHSNCVFALFCNSSLSSVCGQAETRPASLKRSIGAFSDKRTTGMCVVVSVDAQMCVCSLIN